jgi:hypothetical protein
VAGCGPAGKPLDSALQPTVQGQSCRWLPNCKVMDVPSVSPPGLRVTLCRKLLLPAVCILPMASCQKHSVAPFPVLLPPRSNAADRTTPPLETPPSLSVGEATQVNPNPVLANEAGSQSTGVAGSKSRPRPPSAPNSQVQPKLPLESLDVAIPIKSAVGSRTVSLAMAIRDALNDLTLSGFVFECPARIRLGSTEKVRLTARQNLTDMLTQKLKEQGVPAEYLNGIITLAAADLTSLTDNSLVIQPEAQAAGSPSDTWVWRVQARQPGNHRLELKVNLSARIPSRGEVEANAPMLSRVVSVDAEPFNPYGNFFARYWLEMAGSVVGLMGAWMGWTLWRTRRNVLSHR